MTEQLVNLAQTTLARAIGVVSQNTSETILVSAVGRFPTEGNSRINLGGGELGLVTHVSGVNWTVTRGIEGSTPIAHPVGQVITGVLTAGALYEAFDTKGSASTAQGAAETAAATGVAAEATTRANADTALASSVASEKSSRESAVSAAITTAEAASDTAGTAAADVATEKTRAETAEAGKLAKSENLKDVTNAAMARSNLGLGTAAVEPSSAFDAKGAASTAQTAAESKSDVKGAASSAQTAAEAASDPKGAAATARAAAEAASIPIGQKAAASGVASLDGEQHLTSSQVPPSVVTGSANPTGALEGAHPTRTSTILAPVLRDFLSVRDAPWGAHGDNEHDDTTAIKTADEACHTAGGATLWFPLGTYKCLENLFPSANNTWAGQGVGSVINMVDDGTLASKVVYAKEVANVTLRDMRIEQANAAGRTGHYGNIRIEGCTTITLCNVNVGKGVSVGIWACNTTGLGVKDCKVSNTYADGIMINRGCKVVRVTGSELLETGDDSISVVSYRKNLVEGEPNYGPCEDVIVANNTIRLSSARFVAVYGGHGIKASNNSCDGSVKSGMIVTANSDATEESIRTGFAVDIELAHNTIRNSGTGEANAPGIKLTSSRDVCLESNKIYKPAGAGIEASGAFIGLEIIDNKITRCTSATSGRGVYVTQTASSEARLLEELVTNVGETAPGSLGVAGLTIEGNKVKNVGLEAVRVIGESGAHMTNVTINGNRSNTGVTETWAQYFVRYVDGFTVAGNMAAAGNYRGFQVENCTKGTIAGNNANGQLNAELTKASLSEVTIIANSFPGGVELTTETWEPAQQGLLGWSFDPAAAQGGTVVATAGLVHYAMIKIKAACTIHKILMHVTTGGVTLTTGQCFVALCNEAGELLSTSADQKEAWQSTGLKEMALTEAKEVPAGFYRVAFFYNGTTAPAFARGVATSLANAGVSGSSSRFGTANTGRTTTMPAKLEGMAAESVAWWVGFV